MTYPTSLAYNVIGAIAWVGLCMGAGVLFGQIPWVKKNFEVVILGVIFISILPLIYEFVLSRYAAQKKTTLNAKDLSADL
jgi:membrane-associated protein